MATPISTTNAVFYDAPEVPVAISPVLPALSWNPVPYLYVQRLRRTCAPDLDRCELQFEYGPWLRPDDNTFRQFNPADLNGYFVRVAFPDFNWFGQIDIDSRQIDGSRNLQPQGKATLTAYSLLRLLERTRVTSAVIYDSATDSTKRIYRGLEFNDDDGRGEYQERGNRYAISDDDGIYVFSERPRGKAEWNAYTAAQHILKYHPPLEQNGAPLIDCELVGDEEVCDWYKISCETNHRNVKQILDELLDRRRGVGYFVEWDDLNETLQVKFFSFLDANLTLPSGEIITANTNQISLEFEQSVDVERAIIRNTWSSRFDRIVAVGARKTSTFTAVFDPDADVEELLRDWTDAEQTDYLDAASGEAGYALLDLSEQCKRNEVWRREDRLRNVFSRFKFSDLWDQCAGVSDSGARYWIAPLVDADGNLMPEKLLTAPEGEPLCTPRLTVRDKLPLLDRHVYYNDHIKDGTTDPLAASRDTRFTGDGDAEFLPIFAFLQTDTNYWERTDQLAKSGDQEESKRNWSASLKPARRNPGIELKTRGGPPQFLALTAFSGAASTDEKHDPAKHGGLDWQDLQATLCVDLDSYVTGEAIINELPEDTPERVLVLKSPKMRLDYVVPGTVTEIHDGALRRTTDGGYVRDDRGKLQDIARAAAEFYGRTRQAIEISYRQLTELVHLGDLVTNVGPDYNLADVNSPITAIVYDVARCRCTFETSYSDLDWR